MDIKYFAKLGVNFPSPLFKSSQNGVRAILGVQGRALPPTAEVIQLSGLRLPALE
jgi:hypothetical protein